MERKRTKGLFCPNKPMNEPNDKALTAQEPKRALTPKNQAFLSFLIEGKSTLDAYKLAGYKGESHTAYQLRYELKEELINRLEAQGIDKAGLMTGLKGLMELPIEANAVTVKERLDILKVLAKMLPSSNSNEKPAITRFVINTQINNQDAPTVIKGEIVE